MESTRSRVRFDGFDLIRIVARSWSSSTTRSGSPVTAARTSRSGTTRSTPATSGVITFFLTSGFLVAQSWEYDPRPLLVRPAPFARIWPALAVSSSSRCSCWVRRSPTCRGRLLPVEVQLGLPLEHDPVRPGPLPPSGRVRRPAVASGERLTVDAPVRGVGLRRDTGAGPHRGVATARSSRASRSSLCSCSSSRSSKRDQPAIRN